MAYVVSVGFRGVLRHFPARVRLLTCLLRFKIVRGFGQFQLFEGVERLLPRPVEPLFQLGDRRSEVVPARDRGAGEVG